MLKFGVGIAGGVPFDAHHQRLVQEPQGHSRGMQALVPHPLHEDGSLPPAVGRHLRPSLLGVPLPKASVSDLHPAFQAVVFSGEA